MTVDIATLGIRIDSSEARTAARDMENFRGAGARAEQQVTAIDAAARKAAQALQFLGIGAGVGAVIKMADEYTKFTAQLQLATQSQHEYAAALEDVRRIAATAQQDLAATGTLYARIANGTRELGISQKNVADITETVNLALKVSGATSAEAASAMLQLSQSFASGTLRGEEFNAVNEAAPRLMKALADGIGVPVGALKDMASNGEITSKVMAQVLPQALQQLQEEAKHVQTISGAFTVLKNNVLEFTGTQAQANGTVAALTGGIMLLAENLNVLMGVVGTVTAVKIANTFTEWAAGAYQSVAANRALAASNLATAQTNVAATAAALATAQAREAELRASVLAAEGVVALAVTENGLIPAQARAAAAAQAHAAALAAQTAAAGAASVSAGIVRSAVGLLGGPVGAVVTVLGLAATAWSWYSSRSTEANAKTADETKASTAEVVAQMTKQIEVMERRNKLALSGAPSTGKQNPLDDKLAEIVSQMDQVGKAEGDYAKLSYEARGEVLKVLGGQYAEVTALIERFNKASADGAGNTAAAKALVEIRERVTGVSGQYQKDLKTYQTALAEGVIGMAEYTAGLTALAQETWKGSEAGKAAITSANKSAEAYKTLISSIREATATNKLELAAGIDASDSQKARIKLDQELASGKVKLTAGQLASVRAALAEQDASEKALKSQRSVAAAIAELNEQRRQDFASAAAEAAANEQAAANFGLTKAQIEALTVARLEDRLVHAGDLELTADDIAQTERLIAVKKKSADALTKADALGYIKQLSDENKRFAADSIIDERTRAAALLEIDADVWRKRIAIAGDGTSEQQRLQEQFNTWYANQVAKPQIDAQRQFWDSVDRTAHDTFVSILDGGKDMASRLRDTFKNIFFDWLYQMTLKKWIVNVGASLSGSGAAGIAQAAGGASNLLGSASGISSLVNVASTGITASVGNAIAGAGSLFGSSAIAEFGAGMSGAAGQAALASWAPTAALEGVGPSLSAAATAGSQLATAFSAAIPWVAAAGAAFAVWNTFFEDGPEQNTHLTFANNNAAGNISINERGNEGKTGQSYIDNYGTSAFGTFGVSNSFWMSSSSEVVQSFIQTVSKTDDALAGFLTTAEKASVTASLTGQKYTAETGPEGSNPNSTGELDKVFAARIKAILEGIEPGLSALEAGFKGSSQELATETAALLSYRAALRDSGEAVFGAQVTLQQIAALKTPTESTSAALTRITNEFNATNQVAGILGKNATTAFGAAGLASEAARAQIILLSGGLDKFTSQASSFAQNYLTDAERLAPVTKALDEQLAALGLSSVPQTKDQFKQLVMAQDLSSESGQKLYAGLMALQDAFAQVHAEEGSATDALAERKDLQKQLDELTLSSAQLQAKARDAIDATNRSLYDQVQVAQAAKDALAEHNTILDLQGQIAEATGDKAAAAAVLEQQHQAALDGLTPAVAAATQALWAAQAAEKAKQEALDRSNALLQIQAQIAEEIGDKAAAAAILQQQHAAALAALDPALRAATQQLWAAQAASNASKAAVGAVDAAYTALQGVIERDKNALNTAYQTTIDGIESGITRVQDSISSLKSLSQDLHSTIDAIAPPSDPLQERAAAQSQIQAALAIARAGGPLPAADDLKQALATLGKDSSRQFGSYLDYQRDLYTTKNSLSELAGLTDDQLTIDERQLKALQDQRTSVETAHKEDIARLDATLDQARVQSDLLRGVYTSVQSLPAALASFAAAVSGAKADPGVQNTNSIASLYQSLLGRAPDADGLAFYQAQIAKGDSLDKIAQYIKNSPEYLGLHPRGFASGGDHLGGLRIVGENGPELEATGPSRIFNAAQTRSMLRSDNSDVVAELRAVKKELVDVKAEAKRSADSVELLKRVIRNDKLYTKAEATA